MTEAQLRKLQRNSPIHRAGRGARASGDLRQRLPKGPAQLKEHELVMGVHLEELGLRYHRNYKFHDRRAWEFDWALCEHMLAIECEGGGWASRQADGRMEVGRHARGKGFAEDLRKYQEAFILGWNVLRVSVEDVMTGRAKECVARWLAEVKYGQRGI